MNKISEITEGTSKLSFDYGIDQERRQMKTYDTSYSPPKLKKKKFYSGDYEKEVKSNGDSIEWNYIYGGDGLTAIYRVVNGVGTLYNVAKDHLGSIMALYDNNGNTVEEYSYDAWGRRRDPGTWNLLPRGSDSTYLVSRGYTQHEHLGVFDLINMNGRLYDPVVGRMLSPDILVQNFSSTQSYNRYSYVFNNPLKFVDPSGFVTDHPGWEGDDPPIINENRPIFLPEVEVSAEKVRGELGINEILDLIWKKILSSGSWLKRLLGGGGSGNGRGGNRGGTSGADGSGSAGSPGGRAGTYGGTGMASGVCGVGSGSGVDGATGNNVASGGNNGGESNVPNGLGNNKNDVGVDIVGVAEFCFNKVVDADPTAGAGTKGVGMLLSGLSTILNGLKVYDEYTEGGVKNICPVDATSVVFGTVGAAAKGLSFYGIGGEIVFFTGEASGVIGIGLISYQLWGVPYKLMDDLRYAPLYINSEGEPIYGYPIDPW